MDGIIKDFLTVLLGDFKNELSLASKKTAEKMFFLDRQIPYFTNTTVISQIVEIINSIALIISTFVLVKHIVKVYTLHRDGDSLESPAKSIERIFLTSCMVYLSPYIYTSIANISIEIVNLIVVNFPTSEQVNNQVNAGFATLILSLYFWIKNFFFTFVIYKQGIEMLVLRLTLPFGCIGFLSPDGGLSSAYVAVLLKNSATIICQVVLFQLAQQLAYAGGEIFLAIACIEVAWHGPAIMNSILLRYGGNAPSTAGLIRGGVQYGGTILRNVTKIIKK